MAERAASKRHKDNMNTKYKVLLKQEQAEKMGIPVIKVTRFIKSMRTHFGRLTTPGTGKARARRSHRDNWIVDNFQFFKQNISRKGKTSTSSKVNIHSLITK